MELRCVSRWLAERTPSNGQVICIRRWMAFSPPAMTIPKWILYRIAVGIAVVGGENSSTTLTTALHPAAWADCSRLALGETHLWDAVAGAGYL